MIDDPIRNYCVKRCLTELASFKQTQVVLKMNKQGLPPLKLAQHLLMLRRKIEQDLRTNGQVSDFDPLALSAFQESLREAIVRKGPGLQVPVEEVAERLETLELAELWQLFVKHYLGNYLEWMTTATEVDDELGDTTMANLIEQQRKVIAPDIAKKVYYRLKGDNPSTKWRDPDAFLQAFEDVMEEWTED